MFLFVVAGVASLIVAIFTTRRIMRREPPETDYSAIPFPLGKSGLYVPEKDLSVVAILQRTKLQTEYHDYEEPLSYYQEEIL